MPDNELAQFSGKLATLPRPRVSDYNRRSSVGRKTRQRNREMASARLKIAKQGQSSYNIGVPKLNDGGASREFLLKLEFERHAIGLAKFFGISEVDYPDFRASLERLPDRFKAASETPPSKTELTLPYEAEVLYMDRPDPDMNPIAFLRAHWGRYMDAGILYQDTLNDLDPQLVPNVRSYCQRMAKRDPENAASYVAKDHLPPVRPKEALTQRLLAMEPGTVEHAVEKRKADQRERKAKSRQKMRAAGSDMNM